MKKIILIALIFALFGEDLPAQVKGEEVVFNPDTVFVFKSPRKLLTIKEKKAGYTEAAGLDLLFSNFGFGAGGVYQHQISDGFILGTRFFISGARNTDEFEYYDWNTGERIVPNKINRLFVMPLTLTAKQMLFRDKLHKSFQPFVSVGAGPAFILSTPYSKSFFSAFSYAEWYVRPAGSVGIGAVIGSETSSFMSVNIDYYYIPFGGEGLESVRDNPINNFGGVFLSVSIGGLF